MYGVGLEEVFQNLNCHLQRGHDGPHHDLVLTHDDPDSGALWALWHGAETALRSIPHCPGQAPDGRDVCGLHHGHPGHHSWDLYDPLDGTANHALALARLRAALRNR
jgi:hypothetical protein